MLAAFPDDAEAKAGLAELMRSTPAVSASTPTSGSFPAAQPVTTVPKSGSHPVLAPVTSSPSAVAPPSTASGVRSATSTSGKFPAFKPRAPKLGELLIGAGLLTAADVEPLVKDKPDSARSDTALADALVAEGKVEPLACVKLLAAHATLPFLSDEDLLEKAPVGLTVRGLGQEQAEQLQVVPLTATDRTATVAMRDPHDISFLDKLRLATGLQVSGVFATERGIAGAIRKVYLGEAESADQWRGRVWDEESYQSGLTPFSDRVTGTRERQFDTNDLEQRLKDEAERLGTGATSAPVVPKHITQDMPALPGVGSLFAGRYQIEALIGQGGPALVHHARHDAGELLQAQERFGVRFREIHRPRHSPPPRDARGSRDHTGSLGPAPSVSTQAWTS